jgi:gluconate 2-dehydrogenase gamma chain
MIYKISRRRFVQIAALSTGTICMLSRCSNADMHWQFFTAGEAQLMDAIADQMIPPDEWPGGRESGVTHFVDMQLAGPYVRFQENYRNGLAAIQETCTARYRKRFEELPWNEQTAFLEMMEAGKMTAASRTGGKEREFFELFRDHSMQAYYGSPRHGGNKNNMSYKMLRLDYPLIIGQNRYNHDK